MNILALFLLGQAAAENQFRPSSGEIVTANETYLVNWNVSGLPTDCEGIELDIPWMTPPYTSTVNVPSRRWPKSSCDYRN